MMSLDSISKRRICALCTIMAYAILPLLPIGAAAQGVGAPPALTPGLHHLELPRAGELAISYALSIPRNYSLSSVLRDGPVPLVLALHFGVGGGDAAGAGAGVM